MSEQRELDAYIEVSAAGCAIAIEAKDLLGFQTAPREEVSIGILWRTNFVTTRVAVGVFVTMRTQHLLHTQWSRKAGGKAEHSLLH